MDSNPNDETIKEILKEDQQQNGKKKKGCFARVLIFVIFLAIVFFGFIYIQQYLLDLEAQAIVRSAQTATVLAANSSRKELLSTKGSQSDNMNPAETPTPDPTLERTATVAAQLTSVAEFQLTVTPLP